jgi:limonene-1,2-epoxide hydrolase
VSAERVRAVYEAFNEALANRDDLEPLIARTYTEDVEMEPGEADTWLGGGIVRGRDEMLTFWRTWLAETRDHRFSVIEITPSGGGWVVDVRTTGHFKRSGIPFSFAHTHVVELRADRVARVLVRRNRGAEEPARDDADDSARSRPR